MASSEATTGYATLCHVLLGIILVFAAVLLALGVVERLRHRRRLAQIPLRVNVNGSRGKSTVTRLLIGILGASGHRAVGKTTGTTARVIRSFDDREVPVRRRLEGANIREHLNLVREAAADRADAVVAECMAVKPDYQVAVQRMLEANIGVITNVLGDHLDEMGPRLEDVAEALTSTIPSGGQLIVTDGPYRDRFRHVAEQRGTRVTVADADTVPAAYLQKFDYLVFPEHVAIGLAFAEAVGVDRETAMAGMLAAAPDPFATRILAVGDPRAPAYFVSAFPANDPVSTLAVWKHIGTAGYPTEEPVVVMNCRADRVPRTQTFAEEVLPQLPAACLFAVGEGTEPIRRAHAAGRLRTKEFHDLEGASTERIVARLQPWLARRVILGVGNIAGVGAGLVEYFEREAAASPGSAA